MDSAQLMCDSALVYFAQAQDTIGLGDTWFLKCWIHDVAGEMRQAIGAGWKAVRFRSHVFPDTLNAYPKALHNLANLYSHIGQLDSALTVYQVKDSIIRVRGALPFDMSMHYRFFNSLYYNTNDHGRSVEMGQRALAILNDPATTIPDVYEPLVMKAGIESNIAHCLSQLGQHDQAIAYATKGLARIDSLLLKTDKANSSVRHEALETAYLLHGAICDPLRRLNLHEAAFDHSRAIIAICDELLSDEDLEPCAARGNMAITAFGANNMTMAKAYADSAIALVDRYGGTTKFTEQAEFINLDKLFALRGTISAAMGDTVEVSKYFKRAFDHLAHQLAVRSIDRGTNAPGAYLSLTHYAEILGEQGRANYVLYGMLSDRAHLFGSVRAYDQAVDSLAQLSASADMTNRSMLAGMFWDLFSDAIQSNIEAYRLTRERRYAQRIMDILEMSRNALADKGKRAWIEDMPTEVRRSVDRLGQLESELFAAERSASTLPDSTLALRNKLIVQRTELQRSQPEVYERIFAQNAPTLDEAQSRLPDSAAVVEYLIGHDQLHALWVMRDTIVLQQIDLRTGLLTKNIGTIVQDLRSSNSSSGSTRSIDAVYDALLNEPLAALSPKMLTIIPDGVLCQLPFEYLSVPRRNIGEPEAAELLVDELSINYGSSIGVLFNGGRENRNSAAGYAGFAPVSFNGHLSQEGGPADLLAMTTVRSSASIPLPGSEAEVREIASLLSGKSYLHDEATERAFRADAPERLIIHVATHCKIDPIRPDRSGILLYCAEEPTPAYEWNHDGEDDGLLFAAELAHIPLNAELVVLSACETGSGKYQAGEGVMSMARAFNYAGAPNVVSSLWKVDDRATKEIMVKFYENLAEGMGKADALAEAKRWYRKEYPNEPPSKWAAFILIGDNEPVHLKKRRPVQPWLIGGGLAAVIAALVARRRRMRRAA